MRFHHFYQTQRSHLPHGSFKIWQKVSLVIINCIYLCVLIIHAYVYPRTEIKLKKMQFFFCLKAIVDEYKSTNTFHKTIILLNRVTSIKTLAKLWVKTPATINKVLLCPNYVSILHGTLYIFKKRKSGDIYHGSQLHIPLNQHIVINLYRGTLGRLILFCLVNERGRYTSM